MLSAVLAIAIFSTVAPGPELEALKSALGATTPNPDKVKGLMAPVISAADPEAIVLIVDEYDRHSRNLREYSEEVSQGEHVLAALRAEGKGFGKSQEENLRTKMRRAESKRVGTEKTLVILSDGFVSVLDSVAKSANAGAMSQFSAAYEVETRRTVEIDDEYEKTKGLLAEVEFRLRRFEGGLQGKVPLIEAQGKFRKRLDLIGEEVEAHRALKDAVLKGVSSLIAGLNSSDQDAVISDIKKKVNKRQPPDQRALYMELFAGLGQAKGPEEIRKTYQAAFKEVGGLEKELVKKRDEFDKMQQAYFAQVKDADGMVQKRRIRAMEDLGKQLLDGAREKNAMESVRVAAALSLGLAVRSFADPEAREKGVDWLLDATKKEKSPENRALVVESLGRFDHPKIRKHVLEQVTQDKDPRVRVACVEVIRQLKDRNGLKVLRGPVLRDPDFRVRAAAIDLLGDLPEIEAIPALIEAMAAEQGRLREDAMLALRKITGQQLAGDPIVWRNWWGTNEQTFDLEQVTRERLLALASDDEESEGVTFYGIQSTSENVIFVLDVSGSMNEPAEGSSEKKKIDAAIEELKKAINAMSDGGSFGIVLFAGGVTKWQEKMSKVTARTKKRAIAWIDETVEAFGGTNLYGGLLAGFAMAEGRDPRKEPTTDTIFLMADGEASIGEVQESDEIRQLIRDLNRYAQIRINTIAVGREANVALMYSLAEDSGGQFAKR